MTASADVPAKPYCWESLLELSLALGRCRVILQRRPTNRRNDWSSGGCLTASGDCDKAETDGSSVSAGITLRAMKDEDGDTADDSSWDHRQCSVRIAVVGQNVVRLKLVSNATDEPAADAIAVDLFVGDGVDVTPDCLRAHSDHICATFTLRPGSTWLGELLKTQKLVADAGLAEGPLLHGFRCRRCATILLENKGQECLRLPTGVWQACADSLACEECEPLGESHVRASSGRVFISQECLLVSEADLRLEAELEHGADGLVRCSCGAIVGEVQVAGGALPTPQRLPRQERRQRSVRNWLRLNESWQQGSLRRCRGAYLYKHRLSTSPSVADGAKVDRLAAFTEESAVGAQLLALRVGGGGQSRFLLVPGKHADSNLREGVDCPAFINAGGEHDDAATVDMRAIEVRFASGELLVIGPVQHDALGPDALKVSLSRDELIADQGDATDVPVACRPPAHAKNLHRVARVYYRIKSGPEARVPSEAGCQVVGIPDASVSAVLEALRRWEAIFPASFSAAPIIAKDGSCGWCTSVLPLPPCDESQQ